MMDIAAGISISLEESGPAGLPQISEPPSLEGPIELLWRIFDLLVSAEIAAEAASFTSSIIAAGTMFFSLRGKLSRFVSFKNNWREEVALYAQLLQTQSKLPNVESSPNATLKIGVNQFYLGHLDQLNLRVFRLALLWENIREQAERHTRWSRLGFVVIVSFILFLITAAWPDEPTKLVLWGVGLLWPFLWPVLVIGRVLISTWNWDVERVNIKELEGRAHWHRLIEI